MAKAKAKGSPNRSRKVAKPASKRVYYHTVEWGDKSYRLAKIGKGKDVPVKNKIAIAELVCLMYETDQYTLQECLQKCGVTDRTTWYHWRNQIPQIQQRYVTAQKIKSDAYTHNLRDRALTALEKAVTGHTVTTTTRKAEVTNVYNPDGKFLRAEPVITEVITKETHIRANFRAVELVLFNHDKENFQRSPSLPVDPEQAAPSNIKIVIEGGSVEPVTSEDAIITDI